MLVIKLFRYMTGYVRVAFCGDYCERMLNLCAKNHVTLWKIKRADGKIFADMSVRSFKNIRKTRAKSRVGIRISEKHGLPFHMQRYKYRVGFFSGIAVYLIILSIMGRFIWQIEVSGNNTVGTQKIIKACETLGISAGTPANRINTAKQKEQLLLSVDGLTWASLNIEGCKLTVNVSEMDNPEPSEKLPSSLYARFDGVIKQINVKSGNACVKTGDAVVKGDILVTGAIEFPESQITQYVASEASVVAYTKHTYTASVPKSYETLDETGEKVKKSVLRFFGINIPLYLGETRKPYRCESSENSVMLFGNRLPISIVTKHFKLANRVTVNLDDEAAAQAARDRIKLKLERAGYEGYEMINESISVESGRVTLSQTYKCAENIAYEEILNINDLK